MTPDKNILLPGSVALNLGAIPAPCRTARRKTLISAVCTWLAGWAPTHCGSCGGLPHTVALVGSPHNVALIVGSHTMWLLLWAPTHCGFCGQLLKAVASRDC